MHYEPRRPPELQSYTTDAFESIVLYDNRAVTDTVTQTVSIAIYDHVEALDRRNIYAIAYRLHDARRPETRAKRIREFLALLASGKKLIE